MVCLGKFTSGDGGPHFALLDESGSGLLVEGSDGVGDDGDLSLHGGLVSLQGDGLALQLLVSSGGAVQGSLGGGQLLGEVVLALGQRGLGVGQGRLEGGALRVDGGGDGGQRGGGTVGGGFGGLDHGGLFVGVAAQELHLGADGDGLGGGGFVGGLGSLALGNGLGEDGLELGQAFGHLLA